MKHIPFIVILALSLATWQAARSEVTATPQKIRQVRFVMGTMLDITLYHHDVGIARKSLAEAFSLAERLDSILSNYKPLSEVSRLNHNAGTGKVRVSAELYELLSIAQRLTRKTHGAFDITVGPLMELWRSASKRHRPPSPQSVAQARTLTGMEKIVFYSNREVELEQKGIRIDTGGIGKGYAVDLMVHLLKHAGIKRGLVNFGLSSIYAIGSPPRAPAWRLLVQFPGQSPLGFIEVKDQALSASDSLSRSFQIEGKSYGHLIDPQNGLTVTERTQAMVLAPSATTAEALSKYVILRGCTNLEKIRGLEAMLISERKTVQCPSRFPLIPLSSVR